MMMVMGSNMLPQVLRLTGVVRSDFVPVLPTRLE
jgi:predicted ATPase